MLEWRRNKVLELTSQGLNQTEISHQLKVDQSVISRGIKFLREYALKNVETHLQEKLPEDQLCMTGLNQVLKKSWQIANSNSSTVDDKTKLQALSLANECYKYKMDLVTNGNVITDAIKFVDKKNKEILKIESGSDSSDSSVRNNNKNKIF